MRTFLSAALMVAAAFHFTVEPTLAQDNTPAANRQAPSSLPSQPQPADPAPAPSVAGNPAMEAFGKRYSFCREWTDNCQICRAADDGKIQCSTPAIACVQKDITCTGVRWSVPENAPGKKDAGKQDTGKQNTGEQNTGEQGTNTKGVDETGAAK